MINKKYLYLSSLFLFKTSVGAILLLVGWDIIGVSSNSAFNVALITGLAFLPAAFAKPLYKKFGHLSEQSVAATSLIGSSLIVIAELLFISSGSDKIIIFGAIHFTLWTLIFLIETFLERWFVNISGELSYEETSKLSGLSMALIQVGIILGPIAIWATKLYSEKAPYLFTSCILAISAIPALLDKNKLSSIANTSNNNLSSNENKNNGNLFILSFALVWPTVATFNMVIPLLIRNSFKQSISSAVALEVCLAAGSACIGFIASAYKKNIIIPLYSILGILLSTIALIGFTSSLTVLAISIFCIGLFYGSLRISARAALAKNFSGHYAGHIIATSNGLSAPLVVLYLLTCYYEYSTFQSIMFCGLSFLTSGLMFYQLTRRK